MLKIGNYYKISSNVNLKRKVDFLVFKKCLRGLPKNLPDQKKPSETQNESTSNKIIEVVKEKVNIKNYSHLISPSVRLALENNPNLVKNLTDTDLVNEDGDLFVKNYKFKFDADKTLRKISYQTANDKLDSELVNNSTPNNFKNDQTLINQSQNTNKHIQLQQSENRNDNLKNDKTSNTSQFDYTDLNVEEEDPKVPKSRIKCSGCGAKLNCQNKNSEGFLSANKFKSLTDKELLYTLCNRCEHLKIRNKILNIETNSFDYDKFIIKKILSEKKVHVVLLIDLLDIPNSIYEGWSKLIAQSDDPKSLHLKDKIDICILGNKIDLLPNTGPIFQKSIIDCVLASCAAKGIQGDQIKYIELISAKTGFNIEKMITKFFRMWNDEADVYLLGTTNAGKSLLFNQLLSSDFCRTIASNAIQRATTSFWPGTTLNMLKFPITFLNSRKESLRAKRVLNDRELFERIDKERYLMYRKNHDLKNAEYLGLVGSSFKPNSSKDEIESFVDATYSLDPETGIIVECENYEDKSDLERKQVEEARRLYNPNFYKNKSTFFYDTPGVLNTHEILKYFSRQELQIIFPIGVLMPRIYWMQPGQTMLVSGLIRIDLLESTNNERVLFTIMASPAMPVISPFDTLEADEKYQKLYEEGKTLRVPYVHHLREKPLPKLESKIFEISCMGNHKSTSDIVFSCFGWSAVTSLPNTKVKVKAYTLGGLGLELREPSLLPFIVNMRRPWFKKDDRQGFKSKYYRKPINTLL